MSTYSSFGEKLSVGRERKRSVRNASVAVGILGALSVSSAAHGQTATNATIQVQCAGNNSAQVAMRWAHPDYSSASAFMPLFTVPCSTGMATKQLQVTDRNSEFEIQTEGGIQTGYTVTVFVAEETTDQNQMDIFGEVNPKDPITFRACVEASTNPPPFLVIVATFNGTPI